MAEYGLSVVNALNQIQIDSTFCNLELLNSGTVYAAAAGAPTYYTYATIYFPTVAEPPMIFIRAYPSVSVVSYNGGVGAYSSATLLIWNRDGGPDNAVDYLVVGRTGIPVNSGYGLRVFNSAGALAFDSNKRYLKIVDVVQISAALPHNAIDGVHSTYLTGLYNDIHFNHTYAPTPYYCMQATSPRMQELPDVGGCLITHSASKESTSGGVIYGGYINNVGGNYDTQSPYNTTSVDNWSQITVIVGHI